jgi:hypothetical protein
VGQVSKPILIADTSSSGYLFNFRGEVVSSGGGGSLPAWWVTADTPPSVEFDGFVKVAPDVSQALTNGAFTIQSPVGSTANETDVFYIRDEGGNIVMSIACTGGMTIRERSEGTDGFVLVGNNGDSISISHSGGRSRLVAASGSSWTIEDAGNAQLIEVTGDSKMGFFGVAPVVQPAAPITLGDVIAALKTLGLVAT